MYTLISLLFFSLSSSGQETETVETSWIEHPFMALVGGGSCSGSIISLNGNNGAGVILTAAHCMVNDDGSINELAGEILIGCSRSDCDGNDEGIKYIAASLSAHPSYDPSVGNDNDIGLIFLNEAISYSDSKKIDIFDNLNVIKNNDELVSLGYGDNSLEFGITHFIDCQDNELCVDTCSVVDSGSPLIFNNKQIGLVSGDSDSCQVTSIPYYYNWIKSQCPACVGDSTGTPPRRSSISNTSNSQTLLNHHHISDSIQTQACGYHAGTTLYWCWKACSNYIWDSSHWCWTGTRCGQDPFICQRYPMECYYSNEEANC